MLDVVNDRDQVVDQRPRSEVHRLGLQHRAAHVLVFDRQGRVFLQKRSMTKDNHPGVWDSSASGHLDAGEDYDHCATRELREELGWAASGPLQRLFKIDACPATAQEFVWVYRCEGDGPFQLHPEEIDEGQWVEPKVVSRRVLTEPDAFAPAFRLVWLTLTGSGPPRAAE